MGNSYVNALTAFVYILGMAFFLQTVPDMFKPEFAVLGIALMLSLLVLSVALMGFLFFFTPAQLAIEKHFKESAGFFIRTTLSFATLIIILLTSLIVLNF